MTNIGTHKTHCCIRHGCKYGDDRYGDEPCPVTSKQVEQEYMCEDCYYENSRWNPILTKEDLPKEYGEYYVTTRPEADPFSDKPRTLKFPFNEGYREKFWVGSFSAWREVEPLPFPYFTYADFSNDSD